MHFEFGITNSTNVKWVAVELKSKKTAREFKH